MSLAGAIFVMLILYFGSDKLTNGGTRYLMFFDQSVNGLNEGSPVKYRGVPIGTVERILIHVDGQKDASKAIPIIIRIDHDRLVREFVDPNASYEKAIFTADRARFDCAFEFESLITGQLFVELGYVDAGAHNYTSHMSVDTEMVEIPTVGSSLHQITEDAADVIAKITELDFEGVVQNTNSLLVDLETRLENLNTAGVSEAIVLAAEGIHEFVESDELGRTLTELRESLEVVNATVSSYNMDNGELGDKVDHLVLSVAESLDGLDVLVAQTSEIIKPGSAMRVRWGWRCVSCVEPRSRFVC